MNQHENLLRLLEFLSLHGGEIVCSSSLDSDSIKQAEASSRMYVDENNIGFVWVPPIHKYPTTDEEVEQFEKWYPLDVEMPEKFKEPSFLFKKGIASAFLTDGQGEAVTEELHEIPKPIGDFVLQWWNARKMEDGNWYHYADVCSMIRKYHEQQAALTPVEVVEKSKLPVLSTTTTNWFQELLRLAEEASEGLQGYERGGNINNDKIINKVSALCGYAKSAKYVLKDNLKDE